MVAGYRGEDLAGYVSGEELKLEVRSVCASGVLFVLWDYPKEAAAAFAISSRTGLS